MLRFAPLSLAVVGFALTPCWGLESTDIRLHVELVETDYEASFLDRSEDGEFDHSYVARVSMVQPLSLLNTGDLIAVLAGNYNDAREDDSEVFGVDFVYQAYTFRYGMGYRAELGSAFSIDLYPYAGIGWASFELGDFGNDPSLLFEFGAEVDVAATFDQWQIGATAGYGFRYSDHTVADVDFDVEHPGLAVGGFVGYRF